MHPITPDLIEAHAKANGKSINQMCREAGLSRSIFTRWKNNTSSPSVENVNRMIAALTEGQERPTPSPEHRT